MSDRISRRKKGHIDLTLRENVEYGVKTGFEDVTLIHNALPEISRSEIDTSLSFFNHTLKAPIILESMTGGLNEAIKVNRLLGRCAERFGLAIGVGSQRAAIEDQRLTKTYRIVREAAPNAFVFANLGCPQLAEGYGIEEAKAAVEMVKADALMLHANPLQESIQPEGEPNFKRVLSKIREVASELDVPIIIKETGCGVSGEVASKIEDAGAKGIDVAGAGGTSWAAVEYFRAKEAGAKLQQVLGMTFRDWGIPTCISVIEAVKSTGLVIISSGGIRSGLDIAKSISLGATAGGVALPILRAALQGEKVLNERVMAYIEELKTAMFLVGARTLDDLREVPLVISGSTAQWLSERGYPTHEYARRSLTRRF
ncbi:MAG: type 2 isopentenyl-diphosphate Delta-isomerase [Candidatus Bathyarchaeia archaeon]